MHRESTCRKRQQNDEKRTDLKDRSNTESSDTCVVWMSDDSVESEQQQDIRTKRLLMDTGATSHILTDKTAFKKFNDNFQKHIIWS